MVVDVLVLFGQLKIILIIGPGSNLTKNVTYYYVLV